MKIWKVLGLLAIALVFAITACGGNDDPPPPPSSSGGGNGTGTGSGTGNITINIGITLSTSAPSTEALTTGGITESQFNQIKEAGGVGNFLGWGIDDVDGLCMVWSDRSRYHFDAVANLMRSIIGGEPDKFDENDVEMETWGEGKGFQWIVEIKKVSYKDDSFSYPAGTMLLFIGQ